MIFSPMLARCWWDISRHPLTWFQASKTSMPPLDLAFLLLVFPFILLRQAGSRKVLDRLKAYLPSMMLDIAGWFSMIFRSSVFSWLGSFALPSEKSFSSKEESNTPSCHPNGWRYFQSQTPNDWSLWLFDPDHQPLVAMLFVEWTNGTSWFLNALDHKVQL